MNKIYFTFLIIIGFSLSLKGQEQPGLRDRADRFYYEYHYAKAVPIYVTLVDRKKPNLNDLERLADSYRQMNDYEAAEIWYARVIQDPESNAENWRHYAEVLKQNSRYGEAKQALKHYVTLTGKPELVANEIAGCDSALVWMANPTLHKLRNEKNINTAYSEFSAFPIKGKVHYVAESEASESIGQYGWTGHSYLRIYTADGGNEMILSNPEILSVKFNDKKFHVGPISSNAAGTQLYITRTYVGKDAAVHEVQKRNYRTQNLELFVYEKDSQGEWKETAFAYNNVKEYSLGHASLSPDETILYYASNMSGGKGGTDIWYSEKNVDGSWGEPKNAGPSINTSGDELFPSVATNGRLFFSSNGLPGMGGLDIFSAEGAKSQWKKAKNLKYPINSAGDDFAFVSSELRGRGMSGYLSSNRSNGMGGDDIYSFHYEIPKNIRLLKGMTYNKNTKEALPTANVTLFAEGRKIVGKQSTQNDGVFFFELDKESDYKIVAQKASYYSDSTLVSTKGIMTSDTLLVSLYLEPLFEIGKRLVLENIHYDLDNHNIRKDGIEILDEFVCIMRDNPTLKIELSSHTDSRGSDEYNETLSQRRAQAVVDYLVTRGIARVRMVAQGYGERRLLNRCSNGIACSIAEHQANRRTEVEVIEF